MNLAKRLSKLSPEQRELLQAKLKQKGITLPPTTSKATSKATSQTSPAEKPLTKKKRNIKDSIANPINPGEKKEYYPVSASQKRMYILNNFIQYNMRLPYRVEVKDELDGNRIEEVFREMIRRHESLRTTFHLLDGEPVQRIHDTIDFKIDHHDLSKKGIDIDKKPGEIASVITPILRGFDLSSPPLLRVGLIKLMPGKYIFLVNIHHIISDGVSMGIMAREFARLYRGEKLPEMKIQYRDFTQWEKRRAATAEYRQQETYWLNRFSGGPPVLNMPTDHPRPAVQQYEGGRVHFAIEGDAYRNLKKLAVTQGASIYMVLLAVYNTQLHRYTQQEDIVVGSITAGRERWETESIIGVFINAIALRNTPSQDNTFEEFLNQLKHNTLESYKNQSYPFGDLLDKVIDKKDLSRSPLFDVMLIFQSVDMRSRMQLDQLQLELDRYQYETAHHAQQDQTIWAAEQGERVRMDLEYASALFKPETMHRFATHFVTLLKAAAANPELKLSELEIIGPGEKRQIVEQFNNTKTDFPKDKTVVRLFGEQVQRTPDHTAVWGKGDSARSKKDGPQQEQWITYRELDRRAGRLARRLRQKGAAADTIIVLEVERSIEMVIGVWGVLKAGSAYLPLGPDYPAERIDYMMADSNALFRLTGKDIVEYTAEEPDDSPQTLPQPRPHHLCYIIYTSGTTGKPKGVLVQHDNYANLAYAAREEYRLESMDIKILQMANFSFDVFSADITRALLNGGKLIICPGEIRLQPPLLVDMLKKHRVTFFESTPALVIPFLEYLHAKQLKLEDLQLLIVGADTLRASDYKKVVSRFGTRTRILNSYGVTEATIDGSYYEEKPENISDIGNTPIGKPMRNMEFFVLNQKKKLQPIGIPGELYMGGAGIARGYLNNPELTTEKFVPSPLTLHPSPLYKTGDLARWLPDGNIEFQGRIDRQVKVRGFRIELKEVEIQLMKHDDIKEAVVLSKQNKNGGNFLCAYIVPPEEKKQSITVARLRENLSGQLPDYMIPAHFVELEEIPLTANGKIDETALKKLGPEGSIEIGTQYEAPANETEEKLAAIWSEVLNKDRIGVQDNFFDHGGQSILAMRVLAEIQETVGAKIPLITFFRQGTIRGLAEIINGTAETGRQDEEKKADSPGKEGIIRPFDLEKAPLLRATLVKLEDKRHFFFIDIHHIAADGMSMDIIINQLTANYSGEKPPEETIQYKDFSQWQQTFFTSETFQKQELYWQEVFKGDIPGLNLPQTEPLETGRDSGKAEIRKHRVTLEAALTKQLKKSAERQELTLFMQLLAAYTILLAKKSRSDDIVVGTPVAARTHANTNRIVGMFVNTLALRFRPEKHFTFQQYQQNVKKHILTALENQDYPFEMLVEKLGISREAGRNPLFDTMFSVQQTYEREFEPTADNLTFTPYDLNERSTKFDLVLGAAITENEIHLNFKYDPRRLHRETITEMAGEIITILSIIAQTPALRIGDLKENDNRTRQTTPAESIKPLQLTKRQKEQLINEYNDTRMDTPEDQTIHGRFERQAAATPDRTAVISENRQITYGELNRKARQVARQIREKGHKPGEIVGLMVNPTQEMITGILGILKAGGGYLPIHARRPEEQIRYQAADASVRIILTQQEYHTPFITSISQHVIRLDRQEKEEPADRHGDKRSR